MVEVRPDLQAFMTSPMKNEDIYDSFFPRNGADSVNLNACALVASATAKSKARKNIAYHL